MGPKAFVFYFQIVPNNLKSEAGKGDWTTLTYVASTLDSRVRDDRKEIEGARPAIRDLARHVIDHYDTLELHPELDGDLRPEYQSLLDQLT